MKFESCRLRRKLKVGWMGWYGWSPDGVRYEAPYSANNLLSVYPILKDHKDVKRSMLSFDSVDQTPVDGHSLLLWQIHQRNSFAYRAVMGRYVNQKYDMITFML